MCVTYINTVVPVKPVWQIGRSSSPSKNSAQRGGVGGQGDRSSSPLIRPDWQSGRSESGQSPMRSRSTSQV